MKNDIRKTKIVCTIGPASENRIEELIEAGMGITRINFSHGSYEEQREKTEYIMKVRDELGVPLAILLDMQGPEIRTGKLEDLNVKVVLKEGNEFTLVNEEILGNETKTSVSYKELYKDVKPGNTILIDDGAIELKVNEIVEKDIKCIVMNTAKLGSRKSVNVPNVSLKLPALKEKDIQDLKDGARVGFDYVAGSFIRNREDVFAIRKVLDDNGGKDIKLICKIENQEGIDNIEDIIKYSDGIMVARGDLAVEIPFEDVPVEQKNIIKLCNAAGKPVITATQMLESMTENPLPTRAEVSDVANAVYDRTSAIMLSGECAMGKYPVKCVETMTKISKKVESVTNYNKRLSEYNFNMEDLEVNVAYSTSITAKNLKADAIVAYTNTGDSARNLAGIGASCPVFAITSNKKTFNQLALIWDVTPILVENNEDIDIMVEEGIKQLKEKYLNENDTVIVAGGKNLVENAKFSKTIAGIVKI